METLQKQTAPMMKLSLKWSIELSIKLFQLNKNGLLAIKFQFVEALCSP